MSQRNVEQVIGRLVTDEGFRRRFAADPRVAIQDLIESGLHFNVCEVRALIALDLDRVERFADSLHPCIQKVELRAPEAEGDFEGEVENDPARSTNERRANGGGEPNAEPNAETSGDTP